MGRKKVFALLLLFIIVLTVGCSQNSQETVNQEENYVPVEIKTLKKDNIAKLITLNGKVFANEEVMVIPQVPGSVSKISVKLGDEVEKDDVLFIVDQKDVNRALEQAGAGLDLAAKAVQQAENGVKTAQIQYDSVKEKIDNALINLERTQALYEAGAVSKSQLEQAELAASLKPLETVEMQVLQAEIAHEQALDQLRQAKSSYGQVESNFDNTMVKAPISGIVNNLNVIEGELVSNAQPAATVVDMDEIFLQANISEKIVNSLYKGQKVRVTIEAAYGQSEIEGYIDYISPTPDQRNQLYLIKVYLPNEEHRIKPGMSGSIELDIESREGILAVQRGSIIENEGKTFVYIVEDDKAIQREIVLGLDTGLYVEVEKGLKEGDIVIIKGQHYITNGQQVKVVRGE